jgi:hypothetical protein
MSWFFFILIHFIVGLLFVFVPIVNLLKQIVQIQKDSLNCIRNKVLNDAEKQHLLFQKTKILFTTTFKLIAFILFAISPIFIALILSNYWPILAFDRRIQSSEGIGCSLFIFLLVFFIGRKYGKK